VLRGPVNAEGDTVLMEGEHKLTLRSFVLGSIFAVVLCGVNSYLTLSFGIIEEGPAIAALFFFAFFFKSRKRITATEMVIVATMGSAGGSLGFISNFYGAKAMATGVPYTIVEMGLFAIVSSIIGLIAVIVLRQLLIVQDEKLPPDQRLPWVGAVAVKGVIDPLISTTSSRQPLYLIIFTVGAILYIVLNKDGVGLTPTEVTIGVFGLSAYGAGVAFSPFVWGGSYLIGLRTCFGFFVGGVALLLMAPHVPDPSAPHTYVWPGIMFLVTSGMTSLLMRWRVFVDSFKSLFSGMSGGDNDPIMGKTGTAIFVTAGLAGSILLLRFYFGLSFLIIGAMIVIGGIVLNLIATRAAAQTYFNPARVMGILLQGICALLGGSSVSTNLTGAGFVAGSGAQGGNLTGDMAYGRWYGVFSRWQFWTQASTVVACSFVSAAVFSMIQSNTPLMLEGGELGGGASALCGRVYVDRGDRRNHLGVAGGEARNKEVSSGLDWFRSGAHPSRRLRLRLLPRRPDDVLRPAALAQVPGHNTQHDCGGLHSGGGNRRDHAGRAQDRRCHTQVRVRVQAEEHRREAPPAVLLERDVARAYRRRSSPCTGRLLDPGPDPYDTRAAPRTPVCLRNHR